MFEHAWMNLDNRENIQPPCFRTRESATRGIIAWTCEGGPNAHCMKVQRYENTRGWRKDPPVFVFKRKAEMYMLDGSFNSQNSHSDRASKSDNSGHFRNIPSPRCFLFIVYFLVFSPTVLFLVFWTSRYVVERLVDRCSNAIAG